MDVPPSRYRVVERNRRLVVIDTASGKEAARSAQPAKAPAAADRLAAKMRAAVEGAGLSLPTQTRFDGSATLTTAGWYDDKGPRTVTLDPGAMQMIKVAAGAALVVLIILGVLIPGLLLSPLVLLMPNVAEPLRERLTTWLDRYAQDGPSPRA